MLVSLECNNGDDSHHSHCSQKRKLHVKKIKGNRVNEQLECIMGFPTTHAARTSHVDDGCKSILNFVPSESKVC